jgi:formate hydrogenlyase transcriptional activator
LRVTILYNPEGRGAISDGTLVPIKGSTCGKAFLSGKNQLIHRLEDLEQDPESFGSSEGRLFFERVVSEGLKSGCELPLVGRKGAIGVLGAFSRSERAFTDDEFAFLEQVARQVAMAVENALDYEKAIRDRDKETKQRRYLEEEIRAEFGKIVGDSPALKTALELVSVVAPTNSSVLIMGETGTGKELIARAIHNLSGRRERAFVKLNCAAIPLGLLESELFGHEKGAFTDAHDTRPGKFELASGGTLFLDEIGDLSLGGQSKLLRVLEEKIVVHVGGSKNIHTDARVIAATNQNLAEMVRQKKFREDLYFRLNVVTLVLPPLRERIEDVVPLAEHFLRIFARQARRKMPKFSAGARHRLEAHSWPGNVRELRNLMERLAYLHPTEKVEADDLAFVLSPTSALSPLIAADLPLTEATDRFQVEHIQHAVRRAGGNMSDAAELLGVHRSNLYRKMRQLGMPVQG